MDDEKPRFFLAGNVSIHLDAQGHFFANGERVTHEGIARFFRRHIGVREGQLAICNGPAFAPLTCEATPLRVNHVAFVEADGNSALAIDLDDGRSVIRPISALATTESPESSLVITVPTVDNHHLLWARLDNRALAEIAPYLDDGSSDLRMIDPMRAITHAIASRCRAGTEVFAFDPSPL
jgi:hypothetical protein